MSKEDKECRLYGDTNHTPRESREVKQTLLQKAKSVKRGKHTQRHYNKEQVELAVAWAEGQVGYLQVAEVITGARKNRNVYAFLALALAQYYRNSKYRRGK